MSAFIPFEPAVQSGQAGLSVKIVAGSSGSSISGVLNSTGAFNSSILVTNQGGNPVWIRMSGEASPTATQADTIMLPNSVRLFANPEPAGVTGLAVTVSVTTSPNTVWFTAGQGSS